MHIFHNNLYSASIYTLRGNQAVPDTVLAASRSSSEDTAIYFLYSIQHKEAFECGWANDSMARSALFEFVRPRQHCCAAASMLDAWWLHQEQHGIHGELGYLLAGSASTRDRDWGGSRFIHLGEYIRHRITMTGGEQRCGPEEQGGRHCQCIIQVPRTYLSSTGG